MKPEELTFKMAKAKWENYNDEKLKAWDELDKDYQEIWIDDMRVVLRVVLKSLQEGEVVDLTSATDAYLYTTYKIVLNPDFQKFMEGKA